MFAIIIGHYSIAKDQFRYVVQCAWILYLFLDPVFAFGRICIHELVLKTMRCGGFSVQ